MQGSDRRRRKEENDISGSLQQRIPTIENTCYVGLNETNLHKTQRSGGNRHVTSCLTLLATSRASWSAVSRTYAFFFPSGLWENSAPGSSQTRPYSPDQRVHLGRIHIVQFLDGILDLALVRPDVYNKHQCVVFLNLLHRRLSVQWPVNIMSACFRPHSPYSRDNGTKLIHPRRMGNRLARVLGITSKLQCLGPVE